MAESMHYCRRCGALAGWNATRVKGLGEAVQDCLVGYLAWMVAGGFRAWLVGLGVPILLTLGAVRQVSVLVGDESDKVAISRLAASAGSPTSSLEAQVTKDCSIVAFSEPCVRDLKLKLFGSVNPDTRPWGRVALCVDLKNGQWLVLSERNPAGQVDRRLRPGATIGDLCDLASGNPAISSTSIIRAIY